DVVLFEPLIKELRRYLDGEHVVSHLHRPDRLEPGLEALLADVVLDHLEAPVPDLLMVFLHFRGRRIGSGGRGLRCVRRRTWCVVKGGKYEQWEVKKKVGMHLRRSNILRCVHKWPLCVHPAPSKGFRESAEALHNTGAHACLRGKPKVQRLLPTPWKSALGGRPVETFFQGAWR